MRPHLLIVGFFAICSRMTTTSARENITGASVLCAEGICCAGRNRAASCLDWAISTKWRKISPKELKNKWEHCAVVIIACPASGKGVRTSTTNCNCNQQNLYSSLEWNRFNFSAGYGSIIWQFLPVSFLCFRLFTGMVSVDAAAVRFTCSIHLFIYLFHWYYTALSISCYISVLPDWLLTKRPMKRRAANRLRLWRSSSNKWFLVALLSLLNWVLPSRV